MYATCEDLSVSIKNRPTGLLVLLYRRFSVDLNIFERLHILLRLLKNCFKQSFMPKQ